MGGEGESEKRRARKRARESEQTWELVRPSERVRAAQWEGEERKARTKHKWSEDGLATQVENGAVDYFPARRS
eukprot:3395493-Pleurochrysis_carterae.AAC.2